MPARFYIIVDLYWKRIIYLSLNLWALGPFYVVSGPKFNEEKYYFVETFTQPPNLSRFYAVSR